MGILASHPVRSGCHRADGLSPGGGRGFAWKCSAWIVTVLAVAAAIIGALVWHDWPPFMSYAILLVMAIGLIPTG